jgi:hypothetical protein
MSAGYNFKQRAYHKKWCGFQESKPWFTEISVERVEV